jgi:hypothetical protein
MGLAGKEAAGAGRCIMGSRRGIGSTWAWVLGVSLVVTVLPLSQARGGEEKAKQSAAAPAEQKAAAPAEEKAAPAPVEKAAAAEKPAGLVGTIVSAEPTTRTLVVDVPHEKGVLTIGAWATDKTRITAGGKRVTFASLKQGDRVRIVFHRVPSGDVLTSVAVLRGPKM